MSPGLCCTLHGSRPLGVLPIPPPSPLGAFHDALSLFVVSLSCGFFFLCCCASLMGLAHLLVIGGLRPGGRHTLAGHCPPSGNVAASTRFRCYDGGPGSSACFSLRPWLGFVFSGLLLDPYALIGKESLLHPSGKSGGRLLLLILRLYFDCLHGSSCVALMTAVVCCHEGHLWLSIDPSVQLRAQLGGRSRPHRLLRQTTR